MLKPYRHNGRYIGLMTGSSCDGVDGVIIDFNGGRCLHVAHCFSPYPQNTQSLAIDLQQKTRNSIDDLLLLDQLVADICAHTVSTLLKEANIDADSIDAIGCHGQTIRHNPDNSPATTLQIGDPAALSVKTGIDVVADFRRKDIALGGQGAPFAPAFHEQMLADDTTNRVILNLGGIANITRLDNTRPVIGFDTGPANALLDDWAQLHLNESCDIDGRWASSGVVLTEVLQALLSDPYFQKPYPKSTGRDYFNLDWLRLRCGKLDRYRPEDIQASLSELTAVSITNAIRNAANDCKEVLICGGGLHNKNLIARLRKHLPHACFHSTEIAGVNPDFLEATLFAWLARENLARKPINLCAVTGAPHPTLLGALYQA